MNDHEINDEINKTIDTNEIDGVDRIHRTKTHKTRAKAHEIRTKTSMRVIILFSTIATLIVLLSLSGCTSNEPKYLGCINPPNWSDPHNCVEIDVYNNDTPPTLNFTYVECNTTGTFYYPNGTAFTVDVTCTNISNTCIHVINETTNETETYPLCTPGKINPCEKDKCIGLVCGRPIYRTTGPQAYCEYFMGNISTTISMVNNTMNMMQPRMLFKTSCKFLPLTSRIADEIKRSNGNEWVDRFRFGVGTSFEDYDEARYYLPMSDRYTWLNPHGNVDRFPDYLGPRCVPDNSCPGSNKFDLVVGDNTINRSCISLSECNASRKELGGIQQLYCTNSSTSSGEEVWECPSPPPSTNVTDFPTSYFGTPNSARRACELFCGKLWKNHIADCINSTYSPPFMLNGSYMFKYENFLGNFGGYVSSVNTLKELDDDYYDNKLWEGYRYELPGKLDYECYSGADCMSGSCSKDVKGGHVSYRCINNTDNSDINCYCRIHDNLQDWEVCPLYNLPDWSRPVVTGVEGVITTQTHTTATPCEACNLGLIDSSYCSGEDSCGGGDRICTPGYSGLSGPLNNQYNKISLAGASIISLAEEPHCRSIGETCDMLTNRCCSGLICCSLGPSGMTHECRKDTGQSCTSDDECCHVGCNDGVCGGTSPPPPSGGCENDTTTCTDGIDNDGDGFIDCRDTVCWGIGPCVNHNYTTYNYSGLIYNITIDSPKDIIYQVPAPGYENPFNYSGIYHYIYVNPDEIDNLSIIKRCNANYTKEWAGGGVTSGCNQQWLDAVSDNTEDNWNALKNCVENLAENHDTSITDIWFQVPYSPFDSTSGPYPYQTGLYVPLRYYITDWGDCKQNVSGLPRPELKSYGWCEPATYLTIAVQKLGTTNRYCPADFGCKLIHDSSTGITKCDCSSTGPYRGPVIYDDNPGILPQAKYLYDHLIFYQMHGIMPLLIADDTNLYVQSNVTKTCAGLPDCEILAVLKCPKIDGTQYQFYNYDGSYFINIPGPDTELNDAFEDGGCSGVMDEITGGTDTTYYCYPEPGSSVSSLPSCNLNWAKINCPDGSFINGSSGITELSILSLDNYSPTDGYMWDLQNLINLSVEGSVGSGACSYLMDLISNDPNNREFMCYSPGYDKSNCSGDVSDDGFVHYTTNEGLNFILGPFKDSNGLHGSNIINTGTTLVDVGFPQTAHDDELLKRAEAVKRVCPNCLVSIKFPVYYAESEGGWTTPSEYVLNWTFSTPRGNNLIDYITYDFIGIYDAWDSYLNASDTINYMINLSETNLKKYNKPTLFYLSLPGVEESVAGAQTSGRFGFYNNGGWHLYDGSGLFNTWLNDYPSTGLTTVCYYGKWGHGISSNHNNYNVFVGCKVYNSSTFETVSKPYDLRLGDIDNIFGAGHCTSVPVYDSTGHHSGSTTTECDDSIYMATFMYDWDGVSEVNFTNINNDDKGAILVNGNLIFIHDTLGGIGINISDLPLHPGINYITLVSLNEEDSSASASSSNAVLNNVTYKITHYSINPYAHPERANFTKEFWQVLFANQAQLINAGTFGVVYKDWRGRNNHNLILSPDYKTTQFCAVQQASKQLMQVDNHNAYIKVYAVNDSIRTSCPCAMCLPEEISAGRCNATCADGNLCDGYNPSLYGAVKCQPNCWRISHACPCVQCSPEETSLGLCDPICADGRVCDNINSLTGNYKCIDRCARESICEANLCYNATDNYSCNIFYPEGEVISGKPSGSISSLNWYDADIIASLPPEKKCCVLDTDSNRFFTYEKKRFTTNANPPVIFPKYGILSDCGLLPKTNPVNNCTDAPNMPWRVGEMICN